jgi:UDP-2-acetamido-2-deoxy-ribo-hexuluronate aminotransferase
MQRIQMVDLQGQYRKIKEEIDASISEVISSSVYINGSSVKKFEDELALYIGSRHCISCGNGTDALLIAMMALDIKRGDEIIMPAFTFIAAAETAVLLGIKPVFVDSRADTFNIDASKIADAISPRTKAIIPVHLFGQCAEIDAIMEISRQYNIPLIEDAAQSLGAEYSLKDKSIKKAGSAGNIGITSFFPSKNLGCFGDGGALFTNDDQLSEKIRMLTNHGQKEKYLHEAIGLNSRLDTLQAAILNVKLKKITIYAEARRDAAAFYDKALGLASDIVIPFRDKKSSHVFNQYSLILKKRDRDNFRKFLNSKDIPSMVYYPIPVHLQKAYAYLGYKKGDLPVAEHLCKNIISLPMHTELTEDQLSYICENILTYFKNN